MSDNGAPFPLLRAAYLRAIARVWRDPDELARLIKYSKEHKRGVLPKFEEDFNFKFPFKRVKLTISDSQAPRWEPIGTRGWFGFADEYRVTLPAAPKEDEDQTELLAEYMQNFPSMLGRATDDDGQPTDDEAPDDFAWFGLVTGRLIALAWADPEFCRKLCHMEDARGLVQDAMDIIVPWNFRLNFTVHEVTKLPQTAPKSSSELVSLSTMSFDFDKFPLTEIALNMPAAPRQEERAIALAAYNHTGKQYPFTCG